MSEAGIVVHAGSLLDLICLTYKLTDENQGLNFQVGIEGEREK